MKPRDLVLLPSPTPPDVDLAAEAALPFLLEILRERRPAPQLRLVTEESDNAPRRPVPSLV